MNDLATLWSDLPPAAVLIAALTLAGIVLVIALPHVRRAHQRYAWRKLPPPPVRVVKESELKLPRHDHNGRPSES